MYSQHRALGLEGNPSSPMTIIKLEGLFIDYC
jgi:hypothetical protein